jgi:hypothetical protein
MLTAEFRFGPDDEHEFRIVSGYFGRERYYVDDQLLADRWSLSLNAVREFDWENHRIRIEVKTGLKRLDGRAYVDSLLVADDLFAEMNAKLARQQRKYGYWIGTIIGLCLVVLLIPWIAAAAGAGVKAVLDLFVRW